MLGVQELSIKYAVNEKTVRRYLDSLAPLLGQYRVQGNNNRIMLSDGGLAIFDRYMQLRRDSKLGSSSTLDILGKELKNNKNGMSVHTDNNVQTISEKDPLIAELKSRVDEQGRQITFMQEQMKLLMQQLSDAQTQIRNMLTPPQTQRISWWARLLRR